MGTSLTIACIVIALAKRRALLDTKVLPSIIPQGFDEVVVVGEYHEGAGYRYLPVPNMMRNTNDALVKRDVGTLATNADILVYLCDDHGLHWDFLNQFRAIETGPWDVVMPHRYCTVNGAVIPLNMGQEPALPSVGNPGYSQRLMDQMWATPPAIGYLAGHAGIFRRKLIQQRPWTTMPHDRLWDVLASKEQMRLGARFIYQPQIQVEDYEIEASPWR